MMNANSAAPGIPGSAIEKLRALHGPGVPLAAVPIPGLSEWNRRIRMAEAA